jgi:hypothetical protein
MEPAALHRIDFLARWTQKTRETPKAFPGDKDVTMPKENDLEGVQDQGGKHGGQKGMPKPEPKPPHRPDRERVHKQKGDQPRHKAVAPGTNG